MATTIMQAVVMRQIVVGKTWDQKIVMQMNRLRNFGDLGGGEISRIGVQQREKKVEVKRKENEEVKKVWFQSRRSILASTAYVAMAKASVGGSDSNLERAGDSGFVISPGAGKTVFVAGATGQTGKHIVRALLAKGFRVRAGVRDLSKAKQLFPSNEKLEFVLADVTDGALRLSEALGIVDAVIVATGFRPSLFDPFASWKVDNLGTVHLVDAARKNGVKRFVLVSSILVNGAAIGQALNPVYIILNVLGLTLIAKLQSENYIRRSGIDYTVVRPGGLKNDKPTGNIVCAPEDTLFEGSISRESVAEVAVEALLYPEASYKVVEIVARPDAPKKSLQQQFANLASRS